jgi:hypothetical protein
MRIIHIAVFILRISNIAKINAILLFQITLISIKTARGIQ